MRKGLFSRVAIIAVIMAAIVPTMLMTDANAVGSKPPVVAGKK